MTALARRLECTDGQVYTLVLGLVVALALFLIGIPPVLRSEPIANPSIKTAEPDHAVPPSSASPSASDEVAAPPPIRTAPATGSDQSAGTNVMPPPLSAPLPQTPPAPAPPRSERSTFEELVVVSHGYTSSTSGTPLSGPEVPEDGLPVGARLGRQDKASFVRLAGSGAQLDFQLVDDPGANQFSVVAKVKACAITEAGWTLQEPGAPPAQAPEHDPERCVDATAQPDGTWRFDLRSLRPLDGDLGLALLPVIDGPGATFQVTFGVV